MNVVVFASRKGGSGKSTLAAHLAAQANRSRSTLLIDADPQGSLSLWHGRRGAGPLALKRCTRLVRDAVENARENGYSWVFIDTPPNGSAIVVDAIRAATLVIIPARPSLFDLEAVKETIEVARQVRKPYAVVFNAALPKRQDAQAASLAEARKELQRCGVPVWAGQITNRATFSLALESGEGVKEFDGASLAAAEISELWRAVDRSVKALNGTVKNVKAMHRAAA